MNPGRELKQLAESMGWVFVRYSGKHPIYRSPSGHKMPLPSTPGDRRTMLNIRAKLKRYA